MLTGIVDNVKVFGKEAYIADENDNIYAMINREDQYRIYQLIREDGQEKKVLLKNPTQEQKEYALLNLILHDNHTNLHKRGMYNLDIEQICDAFVSALDRMRRENWSTEKVFDEFGFAPEGRYLQSAYNGLIKDIVEGRQLKKDFNKLEYVFRNNKRVALDAYVKAQNGSIYLMRPDYKNYSYQMYEVKSGMELEVKNPTQEQKELALLNVLLKDNQANPNKTGIYNKDIEQITYAYYRMLLDVACGTCDKKDFLRQFALEYSGELTTTAVSNLIDDTFAGLTKNNEQTL